MAPHNPQGRAEAMRLVQGAVYQHGGNVQAAAEQLGISVRSTWDLIRKLALQGEVERARGLRRHRPAPGRRRRVGGKR
jgi:hypothetical protein